MLYTLAQQMYKYEHGLTATKRRAADARMGEAAATMRDLRRSLGGVLRFGRRGRPAGWAADVVAEVRPVTPARVLSGAR